VDQRICDDIRVHNSGAGHHSAGNQYLENVSLIVHSLSLVIEGVKALAVIRLVHQVSVTVNEHERAGLTSTLHELVEMMYGTRL